MKAFFASLMLFVLLGQSLLPDSTGNPAAGTLWQKPLYGDYGAEIREKKPRADGLFHVDTPQMIHHLKDLKVNTYFYLVWHQPSDWDDLRNEFLPAAQKAGIRVWVYLVPPSETAIHSPEPYGKDYVAWARAVARLSLRYPNLQGIVMDDFSENLSFFTPAVLKAIKDAGKKENPSFQFLPQIYYPYITDGLLKAYRPYFDGVVMSFRDDQFRNTQKIDRLVDQIDTMQARTRKVGLPFILMLYTSKLSATPASPSVSYVEGALKLALHRLKLRQIQGVVTYLLQKEFTAEDNENIAPSGMGYANLFVPTGMKNRNENNVQWVQRIYLPPSPSYELTFWHMSTYPASGKPISIQKQLWIDDCLVWKKPLNATPSEKWVKETVHLTPYLKGKRTALLSLRLSVKEKDQADWAYAGFDHLQTKGFVVQNADFEERDKHWTVMSTSRGLIGEILIYDPGRRYRVYQAIKTHLTAFDLYQTMVESTDRPLLARQADHLLNCVLLKQDQSALQTLEQMTQNLIFDKSVSLMAKKRLIQEIYQLYRILDAQSLGNKAVDLSSSTAFFDIPCTPEIPINSDTHSRADRHIAGFTNHQKSFGGHDRTSHSHPGHKKQTMANRAWSTFLPDRSPACENCRRHRQWPGGFQEC